MTSQRVLNISSSTSFQSSTSSNKPIINLSEGEPNFKTPIHICNAAIKAIKQGHHGITPVEGLPELREAISDKLKRDNALSYSRDQIAVSNGSKQAIAFSLLAVINPGDEVIIPAPHWFFYPQIVKLAGGIPVIVGTDFSNRYLVTPEQLERAITDKTKAIIFCSPSNPTGSCYSIEDFRNLTSVLEKYPNITIFSDEIYEYLLYDQSHISILHASPQLKNRTVILNSFSKAFAMTGWRLGYLAGPKTIVKDFVKVQGQQASAPSTISQKAGISAYKGSMKAVWEMRETYRKRRNLLVEKLQSIHGIDCFSPSGGLYVFPAIHALINKKTPGGKTIESSIDLAQFLFEKFQLIILPGDDLGDPNGMRLSFTVSMEELDEATSRLEDAIHTLM